MAFTGISYGNQITPGEFESFKGLISDVKKAKHYGATSAERRNILDLNLPLIARFRKHVGDLSFTHWVSVHGCAPNSHVALYVMPVWCPPIFHRAEMLPTLLDIMQASLKAGEFIHDIEQF